MQRTSRPRFPPSSISADHTPPQRPGAVPATTPHICRILRSVTSAQFKRWLEKQGCTFEPAKGGHLRVFLGKQASILPMHGSSKEIGKGLEHRIKKDLGLE